MLVSGKTQLNIFLNSTLEFNVYSTIVLVSNSHVHRLYSQILRYIIEAQEACLYSMILNCNWWWGNGRLS